MDITELVRAHLDVFYEIERRDVTFRRDYDDARRRAKCPWIMAGRKEVAEQEYEVWVNLHRGDISDHDAIEQLTAWPKPKFKLRHYQGRWFLRWFLEAYWQSHA
ncbi:MAG: hypothetical protein MN733_31475 [Nitrososphaera sp.]|nr:hypothetical protein [Nitrososphaera sp.]